MYKVGLSYVMTNKRLFKIFRVTTLIFFSFLMLRITLPYLSFEPDVKFLKIKQWVIHNDVWRTAFFIHVVTSIFLLFAGFTQFSSPIKRRAATVHRIAGKVYVIILLFLSGPAGLIMAYYANGGLLSRIAFSTLSVLWLVFTAKAWIEIRRRNFVLHGAYMIRSYALTLSAITLRAWKYILVLIFHPHPMDGYMIVAWLGWIPNLLIAEWLIRRNYPTTILKRE
jgi:hypothetical protein